MELTLRDVGEIIKKGWIIILALTVAGVVLGYGVSAYLIQKEYQASAMMIVSSTAQNQDETVAAMTLSDYNLNAKLVSSYSVLSKSDRVLSQVRDKLGINTDLESLSNKIEVTSKQDTDIISLAVTDTSPQLAQSIANTLVDVFKNEVTVIMKMDNVQVIDYAALPGRPVSPDSMVNTLIGGLIGLVASLIVSVLLYILDDTIKESDLIAAIMDVPVIGNVPKLN